MLAMGLDLASPSSLGPLGELLEAPVPVRRRGRPPASYLVSDEGLYVLAPDVRHFLGHPVVAQVVNEQEHSLHVGLDCLGALVLGIQGAPKRGRQVVDRGLDRQRR